jgi:2-dehydro-3-deoxygluconokinase
MTQTRPALFDLVALGEAMVEFNQRADAPELYLQGFGGDTSNAVIAAARQGARCAYLTRLGDDSFGRMLLTLWQHEGVDCSGVAVVPDANTGIYFVTHGPKGHEFSYRRAGSAAATMEAPDLNYAVLESTHYLLVSGISQAISPSARATVMHALLHAKAAGALIAYDPNLRLKLWSQQEARTALVQTLAYCDEFLPGLEEMQLLTGLAAPEEIIAWSHKQGAKTVVLKMGAQGALVSTGASVTPIAGHPVLAVDATGAGDCFNGNYLSRRALGYKEVESARWAAVAAALSTLGYGAVKPLPTQEEVSRHAH